MAGIPSATGAQPDIPASGPRSKTRVRRDRGPRPRRSAPCHTRIATPPLPEGAGRIAATEEVDHAAVTRRTKGSGPGQALHAFDLDKLRADASSFASQRGGKRVTSTASNVRSIRPTVVSPRQRSISIAGSWGSEPRYRGDERYPRSGVVGPRRVRRSRARECTDRRTDSSARRPEMTPQRSTSPTLSLRRGGARLAPTLDAAARRCPAGGVEPTGCEFCGRPLSNSNSRGALTRLGFSIATDAASGRRGTVVPRTSRSRGPRRGGAGVWGYDRLPSRLPATAGAAGSRPAGSSKTR